MFDMLTKTVIQKQTCRFYIAFVTPFMPFSFHSLLYIEHFLKYLGCVLLGHIPLSKSAIGNEIAISF